MSNKKSLLFLFCVTLAFWACGDDDSSNSGTEVGVLEVEGDSITLADGSGEKICDAQLNGRVAEAIGKDFRRCENSVWVKINVSEAAAEKEIIGGVTKLQSSSSEDYKSENSKTSSSSKKEPTSSESPKDKDSSSSVERSGTSEEDSSSSSEVGKNESSETNSSSGITQISSSSEKYSSSEESSSEDYSSSSEQSSSSEENSSDSMSSSSETADVGESSSSTKIVWQYLNPDIDYGTLVDNRDGQVYKTTKIGDQIWMAENLNYDYNVKTAKSTCYTSADTCAKYGRLYTWSAAMDSAAVFSAGGKGCGYGESCKPNGVIRGVCPKDWHLPSFDDWDVVFETLGGCDNVSLELKSTSAWGKGQDLGSDMYGFSALPYVGETTEGLYRYSTAIFWASSEGYYADREGHVFVLDADGQGAGIDEYPKSASLPIRCIKD